MTDRKRTSIGFSLRPLREVRARDLAIRLTFGASVSAVAAVAAIVAGPRFGGLFLAFPAILPATLTLIEKEEHERKAKDDDVGAVLGAVALVPFAGLAWLLLPRIGAPLALLTAVGGWLVSAFALYLMVPLTIEHASS
jgi:uncharacterized membrane protein (GlpM family)